MGGGSQKVSGPHGWMDSEVNTEGQLRSRPHSPLPFSAQPPWVLGASPGSGSCRTTESGSVCGHVAQMPSDTGTEKGVRPNSTSAPVNSLPVLFHLSPGFLISEHFMCLIVTLSCDMCHFVRISAPPGPHSKSFPDSVLLPHLQR